MTEPFGGATRQIADLGDLEGDAPGARYAGSAGILPAWWATEDQEGKENS